MKKINVVIYPYPLLIMILLGLIIYTGTKTVKKNTEPINKKCVYVIPDSTLKQISEIHQMSKQIFIENQKFKQYQDKEILK